jgi:hypothetical protein
MNQSTNTFFYDDSETSFLCPRHRDVLPDFGAKQASFSQSFTAIPPHKGNEIKCNISALRASSGLIASFKLFPQVFSVAEDRPALLPF